VVDIASFADALTDSQQFSKRHLLIGNGFSIACCPDIFHYGSLFKAADFSTHPELIEGDDRITASIATFGKSSKERRATLLADVETVEAEGGTALREAKDFLVDLLATGPQSVKAVQAAARNAGHSWATARRAKDAPAIVPAKTSLSGGWEWSLPPEGAHQNLKMLTPQGVGIFGRDEHLRDHDEAVETEK